MPWVRCLSCGKENDLDASGGYCEECGAKLPPSRAWETGLTDQPRGGGVTPEPRWNREDDEEESSDRGRRSDYEDDRPQEPSEEMLKARKEVSSILFAISGLQFVCGTAAAILLPAMMQQAGAAPDPNAAILIIAFAWGLGAVYLGLGFWARSQPLPPAVIGLLLYLGAAYMDYSAAPDMFLRGVWVKAIIVFFLVRGVITASKAR
jgi:hypothetical protein